MFAHVHKKTFCDTSKNLFKKLEEQNNFVIKLHESKGISDSFAVGQNKVSKDDAKALLGDVGNQGREKMAMALEFNRSQYVFSVIKRKIIK
jgi:hypothetical protein